MTPIAALVSAINASCPEYQAIETGPVGNDAITVGIIYKPESVFPIGTTAILDDIEFTDPSTTGRDRNRNHPGEPARTETHRDFRHGDQPWRHLLLEHLFRHRRIKRKLRQG